MPTAHGQATPLEVVRPKTILLVDDERDIRDSLAALLEEELGIKVFTACDASAAIEVLASQAIGLVLSDHQMPGMKGGELLGLVHLLYPTIPVFLMSAFREGLPANPSVRFLPKPMEPLELAATLRAALASPWPGT